ncbi:MAG: hypothetical protein KDA32_08730 [Phycisphaerales bacterium]|nr:hypothetical protein [Phycisphaerales bacterium]
MATRSEIDARWRDALGIDENALRELLASDADAPLATGQWNPLTKPGLGGRRRWRWTPNGGAVIYVKRYADTPLGAQWDRLRRQTMSRSRAWWEFEQARRLAEASVPAAAAIAFVEQMRGVLESRSVVLLAAADGAPFDARWREFEQAGAAITRGTARFDITRRLARFVGAFHGTGLRHRDLYLCHIFADIDANTPRPPRFTLIDLARVFRPRMRVTRWTIKDLSQLDASARQIGATRTDRLRFLQAYLGLQRRAPRVRWFAQRIVAKSDWIMRQIARRDARG